MITSNEHVCILDLLISNEIKLNNTFLSTKIEENQLSLLSPKPIEHYGRNVRPPSNLTYQRATPKIFSRQDSYSPLLVDTPMTSAKFSGSSRGSSFESPRSTRLIALFRTLSH